MGEKNPPADSIANAEICYTTLVMKVRMHFPYLLLFLFGLQLLPSCRKENDSDYYIEATINGVKWKGKSTGDYLAAKSDNSQMKIFIEQTVPPTTSINFFSNSSLTPFYYRDAEFELVNGYIAPFDSKLTFKWETTFEKTIDKFYIMQSISNPEEFQIVDSVKGGGTTSAVRSYSVTPPNVKISYLSSLKYRFWITLTGGASFYSGPFTASISPGKAQIIYSDPNGRVYFPLDNNQNQLSVTSYDAATSERRGTFSFNYKDDSGKIVEVKNGKFHLKL